MAREVKGGKDNGRYRLPTGTHQCQQDYGLRYHPVPPRVRDDAEATVLWSDRVAGCALAVDRPDLAADQEVQAACGRMLSAGSGVPARANRLSVAHLSLPARVPDFHGGGSPSDPTPAAAAATGRASHVRKSRLSNPVFHTGLNLFLGYLCFLSGGVLWV